MTNKLFNNQNQGNQKIIGMVLENYSKKFNSIERILIDDFESDLEKEIRKIFNEKTKDITIFDDLFYIKYTFEEINKEIRNIIPYMGELTSMVDFKSTKIAEKMQKYYEFMNKRIVNLSYLNENNMLNCSGQNLLILKSIPYNHFNLYNGVSSNKTKRIHSIIGIEISDLLLTMDISENKTEIISKNQIEKHYIPSLFY
ncbi:MAG: hypothetical protein PHT94_04635 [Candidatus Nanoarchaeia archaeon]|nr:hypothetical protein [Candidatus Nanoarchaeia archaeon]